MLDQTVNAKEYKAITKEIRAIGSQIIEQEDLLLSAWNKLENAQKHYTSEKSSYEAKIQELHGIIHTLEEKIKASQERIKVRQQERISLTQKIPKESLQQYERMKHQVDDPIVPVVQNSCSACFYNILFQDLGKLKKSNIVHCKNCYRFLYYDEQENQDPKATTY